MESAQVICLGEALLDRLGPIGGEFDSKNSCNDFLNYEFPAANKLVIAELNNYLFVDKSS